MEKNRQKSGVLGLLTLLLLLTVGSGDAKAQDYRVGVGAHLGSMLGVTMRYKVPSGFGFEFRGGYQGLGFLGVVMGQYEIPLNRQENFLFYTGFGAHAGGFKSGFPDGGDPYLLNYGADVIGGLEYVSSDVPLSLSIDIRPEFNFGSRTGVNLTTIGLNVRYLIF